MKHHPSCGTTYMEDCECEAMTNPTPAVEAALDEYVRLYVEALDATDGVGTQEANEARARVLALLRQPEAATDADEVAAEDALRERMADLLSRTAVALRGPEPPLTRWSWHDLPERAAAAIKAIDGIQKAAAMLAAAPSPTPGEELTREAERLGMYDDRLTDEQIQAIAPWVAVPHYPIFRAGCAAATRAAARPNASAEPSGDEAVAWEWKYIGNDAYAKHANRDGIARKVSEMDPHNNPYPDTWEPVRPLYTAPPPAAVPAGFKLLGYANAFRIKQTCADKPGGAHLGQVAIYAGESVDPMEIQERENPTHMGEPLLGHGWKPIGSAPRTPDAWFLAWHPDTGCGLTFWNAGKFYSYAPDDPPTHWMPLPARPDAPAGEKGT